MLDSVDARGVEADDHRIVIAKCRPGAGREISEPTADGQNQVGLCRQVVGGLAAGDPNWAGVERVVGPHVGLAGHRFHYRDSMNLREGCQVVLSQRVVNSSPGDDERLFGCTNSGCRCGQLLNVGTRPPRFVGDLVEEDHGKVE